ncbi:gastrin-releasing peptide receptor-like isoform X2 [Anneissia japonica]|nr:gastrin-releasing peptide receptor-like isoform X2 [Anneissia japonica]
MNTVLFYLNTIVCCLGIVFNLILTIICLKLCAYGSGRSVFCGRAYFFVMWLCMCNFLFLMYRSIFRILFNKTNDQIDTNMECKLYNAFEVIAQGFAIYTLVALSLDRYGVVLNPTLGITLVTRYRYLILLFIFLISIGSSVPILIYGKITSFHKCEYIMRFTQHALVYETTRAIVMYVLPLVLISIFYVKMAMILYGSRHSEASQNSTNYQQRTKQRNRLALSVLLITIIFGVCHFSINLGMCLQERYTYIRLGQLLTDIGRPLVYINACTHPIVVFIINRAVRNELRPLVRVFSRLPDRRSTRQTINIELSSGRERHTSTYTLISKHDTNNAYNQQKT